MEVVDITKKQRVYVVQDLVQHKDKFCMSQQSRIEELMKFVKEQRARRKQVC